MTLSDRQDRAAVVAEMRAGIVLTLPFILGAIPFAIIFGIMSSRNGLTVGETVSMSLFVFSGSAQIIAVTLIGLGADAWVIWLATFILNLRHTLYAATLVPYVRHLALAWRLPLSAFLTDETFAAMETHYRGAKRPDLAHWAFFASCAAMYINWNFWTFVSAVAGQHLQGLAGTGLEFGVYAAFIGMVVPRLRDKPSAAAAFAAAAVSVIGVTLPYKLNITLAALIGVAVATAMASRGPRASKA